MSLQRTKLQERYELRNVLGRGGMGVVYTAFDRLMNREVALKTILDIDNSEVLGLFYKEWSTLATMVHPNVISIYDIGEFEQDGAKKPFFVMPLLPGVTLDRLIKEGSPRLSVAGVVSIIDQAARGLHAAHEQGLVHRDVKPSNIFVMDDGSVKIIDFGIARMASANSKTTLKGTLYYLAPEQLELKPPTPLSDLFALGVVTYEALTRRRPFQGANEQEVIEAIQHLSPPPVSELNHEVSFAISQVVHKAMAKQPWHRFFNIRELGDALTKASRNEPLEYFDSAKIKPRLERATESFEKGDYEFASEILSELEGEGHLDQSIAMLRGQVDQAVRQIRIKQMLENGRRFFEAGEYPLALRKIQEALDLDPQDATALSLKASVEKQRREKKISEWITLARQHMEHQAFRQAREALDNILQMKPNDTDALQLSAEIGRREQEMSRAREEKGKLYQAAMHAWEKGEMSSALTKLEVLIALDRDMPESDTARSNTYQTFYNKVHSEHNALRNAYEEARRNLAADNFDAALAVCKQYLAKYPNHALFQALKFDVDERQRQSLSAVIADTDRRVDAEPDMDRRLAILEEALKAYPGEAHFTRALQLVRDKRDLVNSIVAKARFFEERGQFMEALDQWQILKSIHEKQPGLAFEIERVIKRRDQQARQDSKARWVEQTDKYIEQGDYDRALKTVENALTEFPGEAELLELDKLVRKNQDRAKQARDLLERARLEAEKGPSESTVDLLRQARELDPKSTVIRTVLVNTLLQQARQSLESNPDGADAAVQEILQVDPDHVPARSLASQIADRKREDFITWCLAQARRLQTNGDLEGALAAAAQGLASCPDDKRLQQLKATLERANEAQRLSQTRAPRPAPASPNAPSVAPAETALTAATNPPATPPREQAQPKQPINPQPEPAPLLNSGIIERIPVTTDKPAPPPSAAPPPKQPAPPPPPAKGPRPPSTTKYVYAGFLGTAAILALVAWGVHSRISRKSPEPVTTTGAGAAAGTIKVNLHASPAGAQISVNGTACGSSDCAMELAPGEYRATASLPDYQNATATFTVGADGKAPPDVNLTLSPVPALVTISADPAEGSVLLDRAPLAEIKGDDIKIPKLSAGTHDIFVQNGVFRSSINLKVTDGAMPQLSGPVQTQGMQAFVLVHEGANGKVYGSVTGAKATLDGNSAGTLGASGLELNNLAPGSHELLLESANTHARILFDGGPVPAVNVSVVANQNLSVLNIASNEDNVQIFIDGDKYKGTTKHGRARMFLPPKHYSIRVEKDGFATPPEQTVDLRNGQESQLSFNLSAQSALAIHHGLPGSTVFLDGNRIGTIGSDGEFSSASVGLGRHTVSIRHEHYKPIQSDEIFLVGRTVDLDGSLQSSPGTLKIELTPQIADARIRLRRQGEPERDVKEGTLNLAEGSYTVSVSAPHYQEASVTVHVTPDATAVASLKMNPIAVKAAPPVVAANEWLLNDWLKVPGWTNDNQVLRRRGGDFVLVPRDLTAAVVQFTAILLHGKRLEWVAAYRDPKNYVLFQMDDMNFNRTEVVDGKHSKTVKILHHARRDDYNTFNIEITPHGIVHSIARDQQWFMLDRWEPDGGVPEGKFGFYIQGRDEIGLAAFKMTSK